MEENPIVRGRPVVLQSKDGHALWVSQKILDAMLPFIPDHLEGGVIARDLDGNPSGVFLDKAQDLVPKEPATEKQLLSRWAAMVKDAHAVGLTSVHDAGFSPVSLQFFQRYVLFYSYKFDTNALIFSQAENNNLPVREYSYSSYEADNTTVARLWNEIL